MPNIELGQALRGRDRMSDVLNRYLEPSSALERANNIAQALVLGAKDPTHIALEMLDDLGIQNMDSVAAEVKKAWTAGISPRLRR